MKKKYKRILKVIILLLLAGAALSLFFPEVINGFLKKLKSNRQAEKIIEDVSLNINDIDKVLGEKAEDVSQKLDSGEGVINVEKIIETVIKDPVIVKQIEEKVETVIHEKTIQIQKIPEEIKEEVKKEVKEEVKKRVCEEWLDSAEQNNGE